MASTFFKLVNSLLVEMNEQSIATLEGVNNSTVLRMKNYINLVYQQLFDMKPDWSWTRMQQYLTTLPQQDTYTTGTTPQSLLPETDFDRIYWIQGQARESIQLMHYLDFKRKFDELLHTGHTSPSFAYVLNNTLVLYPTPQQATVLKITSNQLFKELVQNTDEPLLPESKRNILFHGALSLALSHDNQSPAMHYNLYKQGIENLKLSENTAIQYQIQAESEAMDRG
jgi:hypothetical protein